MIATVFVNRCASAHRAADAIWLSVWVVTQGGYSILGLLTLVRRVSGAHSESLTPEVFLVVATVITLAAALIRAILYRKIGLLLAAGWYYGSMGAVSAALAAWMIGVMPLASAQSIAAAGWLIALTEEAITWPLIVRRRRADCDASLSIASVSLPSQPDKADPSSAVSGHSPTATQPATPDHADDAMPHSEAASAAEFGPTRSTGSSFPRTEDHPSEAVLSDDDDSLCWLQELSRGRTEDGREVVFGRLRLTLAAKQQSGVLHVAFCPPLRTPPSIEALQIDGPESRIRVTHAFSYGARFEVKLLRPAEETADVVIEFTASERSSACFDHPVPKPRSQRDEML